MRSSFTIENCQTGSQYFLVIREIIDDGTFIGHYIVMQVTYSIVTERKKLLIFDHMHDICDYSNEMPKKSYENIKVFAVDHLPSPSLDKIAQAIESKEDGEIS
jgi:hypothetical protein